MGVLVVGGILQLASTTISSSSTSSSTGSSGGGGSTTSSSGSKSIALFNSDWGKNIISSDLSQKQTEKTVTEGIAVQGRNEQRSASLNNLPPSPLKELSGRIEALSASDVVKSIFLLGQLSLSTSSVLAQY